MIDAEFEPLYKFKDSVDERMCRCLAPLPQLFHNLSVEFARLRAFLRA